MLRSAIVRPAGLCTRRAWLVIALVIALSGFCAVYAAQFRDRHRAHGGFC